MLRAVSCGCNAYLAFEELERIPFLFHLFTTRQSGPPLLPPRSGNDTLLARLRRDEPVVSLRQLHGNSIHWVSPENCAAAFPGDGLLTSHAGLLLAVQTADCLPVLLVDCHRRVVGNLHAGWRGTLAGITGTAIRELLEDGSDPKDLLVAFGPAIGGCCYQVGPEVAAAFRRKTAQAGSFFIHRGESAFLDLQKANTIQALSRGLQPQQILHNARCTRCEPDDFFSYRRQGEGAGRMFALIGIQ